MLVLFCKSIRNFVYESNFVYEVFGEGKEKEFQKLEGEMLRQSTERYSEINCESTRYGELRASTRYFLW